MRITVELTPSIFEELIAQQIINIQAENVDFESCPEKLDRLYEMSLALKEMSRLIRAMSKTLEEKGLINPESLSLETNAVVLENKN